jgi:hypothetical protein
MRKDQKSFYQRKFTSKNSIEKNSDRENRNAEKSTVPPLEIVAGNISNKQSLDDGSSYERGGNNTSLPCSGAKPSYRFRERVITGKSVRR